MRAEILTVGPAILLASWLVSLRLWPHTRCSACNGTGRNRGSTSKRYGRCWRCKGAPERLRFGARWVNRRLR